MSTETDDDAEVIVEAQRVPVVKTPTRIVPKTRKGMIQRREDLNRARIFVRCLDGVDPATLRTILDGPPHKASTVYAQGLLIATHIGCHLKYEAFPAPDPARLGGSIYDRGALLEYALERYVPHLSLTQAETNDAAVQRRFNAREIDRNRWRLPVDHHIFEIAVCMVRIAPDLSVRLAQAPDFELQLRLQAAVIGRARICVGDAKKVVVDATQFRMYIADAVWRWVEAARDVDSLIPLPEATAPQ